VSPSKSSAARTKPAGPTEFTLAAQEILAHWIKRQEPHPRTHAQCLDDSDAAIAIVHADCFGNVEMARAAVDELFTVAGGQLPGRTLMARWAAYLCWNDVGKPVRMPDLTRAQVRQYREVIQAQLETALREAVLA
jgi:hypothetical protein